MLFSRGWFTRNWCHDEIMWDSPIIALCSLPLRWVRWCRRRSCAGTIRGHWSRYRVVGVWKGVHIGRCWARINDCLMNLWKIKILWASGKIGSGVGLRELRLKYRSTWLLSKDSFTWETVSFDDGLGWWRLLILVVLLFILFVFVAIVDIEWIRNCQSDNFSLVIDEGKDNAGHC